MNLEAKHIIEAAFQELAETRRLLVIERAKVAALLAEIETLKAPETAPEVNADDPRLKGDEIL